VERAECPFCERIEAGDVVLERRGSICVRDAYPVSIGHTLVVPVRHTANFFALPEEEQAIAWRLVAEMRDELSRSLSPDGFTIGLNDGSAAGQTVAHAHIHVIPRFAGDHPDPRGGIRWVLPDKAAYWR
jgi:diadenosine tetraphosphate (Ap4A) HIT family hydrolase